MGSKSKSLGIKSFLAVAEDESRRGSVFSQSEDGSEVAYRKQLKYGGSLAAAWALFVDYSGRSSLHGVSYLGERHRHYYERAFWIIALMLSTVGCSMMIEKIYSKWQYSPVIVSFAEKSTPVWHIPYPAVTICPETKVRSKVVNFTDAYHQVMSPDFPNATSLSEDEKEAMEALAQVCDAHLFGNKVINSSLEKSRIVPLLKEIAPNLTETVVICRWRNKMVNCTDYFTEILTEEGYCYTFNVLDYPEMFKSDKLADDFVYNSHGVKSTNWSLQEGYNTEDIDTYPWRVFGPGARAGFNIVLQLSKPDREYLCRGPVQGFKILLHTPGEIPRVSKQYFRVPSKQEVLVSVKPNMMTTSPRLINYSPERRQCYFNGERDLQFFKVYTQNNCELECLANFTLNKCGCVKFSMPRGNSTEICGQKDVNCYNEAEDLLLRAEVKSSLGSDGGEHGHGKSHCDCLPSCTSITYDAELSQADFDYYSLFQSFKDNTEQFDEIELARLTIFFKEAQFITSKRSELYDWTDFMANCGGLLGLFMGFSILSLIEILYYMTLRLFCNLRYRRKSNKVRPNDQNKDDNLPGVKVSTPDTNMVKKD